MRENKSKYAMLGVLSMGARSGYDIKKTIESSLSNFWSESYGQIYPILKGLVAEGLATSTVEEQAGRPDRHVYTLTEQGREELESWLKKPVEYAVGRNELLLKLFFGRHMPPASSMQLVEEFKEEQQRLLAKYAGIESWLQETYAHEPSLPYWLMTINYGRHVAQAIAEWCDETKTTLEAMPGLQGQRGQEPENKEEGQE